MSRSFKRSPVLAVGLSLAIGSAAATVDAQSIEVSSCGQTVDGEGGFLSGNLDCSAFEGAAVSLAGRLELNGFTLTGNSDAAGGSLDRAVIRCPVDSHCEVVGPGLITGGEDGVLVDGKSCSVSGVTIADNTHNGISGHNDAKTRLVDSTITRNGRVGISGVKVVRRSSIVQNGDPDFLFSAGVDLRNGSKLEDCDISDNFGVGVSGSGARATFKRVTVSRNERAGFSAAGGRFKILASSIQDNGGIGISTTDRVKISDTTVAGNASYGIAANQRIVGKRSTVQDNCLVPDPACVDLLTCHRAPKIKEVMCRTSADCFRVPWGVCSDD